MCRQVSPTFVLVIRSGITGRSSRANHIKGLPEERKVTSGMFDAGRARNAG
jgi:hypothetical protein